MTVLATAHRKMKLVSPQRALRRMEALKNHTFQRMGFIADGATKAEAHLYAQESAGQRRLSDRDLDAVIALLDSDLEPTEALKEATAKYNKGCYIDGKYHFELPASGFAADSKPF